jgi:hypothetical protein
MRDSSNSPSSQVFFFPIIRQRWRPFRIERPTTLHDFVKQTNHLMNPLIHFINLRLRSDNVDQLLQVGAGLLHITNRPFQTFPDLVEIAACRMTSSNLDCRMPKKESNGSQPLQSRIRTNSILTEIGRWFLHAEETQDPDGCGAPIKRRPRAVTTSSGVGPVDGTVTLRARA